MMADASPLKSYLLLYSTNHKKTHMIRFRATDWKAAIVQSRELTPAGVLYYYALYEQIDDAREVYC